MEIVTIQKITIFSLLGVFFLGRYFWSLFEGKRNKMLVNKNTTKGRFWISIIIYALLPILIVLNPNNIFTPLKISEDTIVVYFLGLIVSLLGLLFMFLARFHRQSDWGFMGDTAGQVLFTKGIYSITRHPYYVGAAMVIFGIYLILNSWSVLLVLFGIPFLKKVIGEEETFLSERFGDEWVKYKNRVGIIPWLKI